MKTQPRFLHHIALLIGICFVSIPLVFCFNSVEPTKLVSSQKKKLLKHQSLVLFLQPNKKHIDSKSMCNPTETTITKTSRFLEERGGGSSTSEVQQQQQQQENSILRTMYTTVGGTTSMVVAGTFFIALAYYRDALMVTFFIGAISNGILSKVLKKILKQERPAELDLQDESMFTANIKPSDNGMPSSHAMSLGFIGTYTALTLPWTRIPLLFYVLVSLIYRVESKLHSWDQIVVGVIVGSTNGYVWRMLSSGDNPWNINLMDWVSVNFLNEQGILPIYMLAVPALVGMAVVGSVERRIGRFLKSLKEE